MTIPNTLAALPNSQYPTALSLVFGKELFFVELALLEKASDLALFIDDSTVCVCLYILVRQNDRARLLYSPMRHVRRMGEP